MSSAVPFAVSSRKDGPIDFNIVYFKCVFQAPDKDVMVNTTVIHKETLLVSR